MRTKLYLFGLVVFLLLSTTVLFAQSSFYVDGTKGTDDLITGRGTQPGPAAWKTIQYALDHVGSNVTINVAAGTYDISGTLKITQGVTLRGPFYSQPATSTSRGDEAILNDSRPAATNLGAITINTTSAVVIEGFTFNGSKIITGQPANANLSINNTRFILQAMPNSGQTSMIYSTGCKLTFNQNYFQTTGFNASNSAVLQVAGGYTGSGSSDLMTITNNYFKGIPVWTPYNDGNGQSTLQLNFNNCQGNVSGNTFDGVDIGVIVAGKSGNMTISNNVFENIKRDQTKDINQGYYGAGVMIFNPSFTGPVTISGNTFQNSDCGIRTSTDDSSYTETGSNIQFSSNTFSGNLYNIADKMSAVTFNLDGNNLIDGVTLSSATTDQLFSIEDKILDKIDNSNYGLVVLKPNNKYVTPNSFYSIGGTTSPSIQRAIDASSSGDNIYVEAGTYKEQLNITKGLTLTGDVSHPDNVIIDGENITNLTNDGQVRIYNPAGSVVFEGFTIINTGTHGGEYFAVLTKGDAARTIQDCKIIGHGVGVGLGNDYGMWADGGSGELTIKDNYFNNTYHGILLERQSGPSTISGNTFDNLFTGTLNGVKYGGRAIEEINYGASDITSLQKISNNNFMNFKSTGVQISGGFSGQTSRKFTNVLIENNDFDFSATDITNLNGAVYLTNPLNNDADGGVTAVITNNTFHVPSGNGLQVYGLNGTITCNNNSFEGNGKYGVKADSSLGTAIDATLNWWNNASGPYNAATNPLGTGDSVTNNVVYSPWLGNKTDTPHDANHPWTWYVNSGSINNVINNALAGDTIIVLPGTYDAFTINKPLVLNGSGNVFINHGSPAITVSSTGVTIIGFTFNFDAAFYAVRINNGAYNVTIHNCKFMNLNGSGATGFGVLNQGSGVVDAAYNYWNSSTGPTIASNANGTGSTASNTGAGHLNYSPWYFDKYLTITHVPVLSTPSNGQTGVSVFPKLIWFSDHATSYKLYVNDNDGNWGSALYAENQGSDTSKIFSISDKNFPLANASKYYWKVAALDSSGNEYTSDTYHFTTITAAMPTLLLPANGVELGGASTMFSWYTLVSGIQFELQISTSSDFNSFVIDTTTANTFVSVDNTNFALGTTYFWRVISKTIPVSGNPVIINYSGTRKFSMEGLPKPIAYYPVNNASVISNPPTMNWYVLSINPKVTEYHVKYSTTPNDGSLTFPTTCTDTKGEFSTGTTDSYSVIPHALKAGTKYYWSVASSDGIHESAFSDETSFTVFGNVQFAVCYPSYPTGSAQLFTNQPTLYWFTNMFAPGLQYQVRYSTDQSTWTKTKANKIFTTSYTFPDELTASSHYYWQVRASFDGSNWGPWSASGDFLTPSASTNASVPVPLPMFPSWGNVVSTVSPTLSWLAFSFSPLEYQVIWSTDPTLTDGVLSVAVDSSAWTSSDSYALSGLTQGSPYYWQVRSRSASDNSLVSAWSTLAWFMTSPGASEAVVPIAGNPIGGSPINGNSTTLSWVIAAPSTSTLNYEVQYSKQKDFSNAVTLSGLADNNVTISNLDNETTYYWRVLSKTDSGNTSSYSASAAFKTINVTSVEKENVIPKEFSLSQNYPNPFNPTTAIVYAIPKNTFVSIKIYNMLGQEVKTLVNSQMQAGTYTVQWNGDNEAGQHVTSGAYIYRIVAGNNVAVRKMLLIK